MISINSAVNFAIKMAWGRWGLYILIASFLVGCAGLDRAPITEKRSLPQREAELVLNEAETEDQGEKEQSLANRIVYQHEGTEEFVQPDVYPGAIQRGGSKVSVNFRNAPLLEVVQAILGDVLKVPYTLEGEIAGTITLVSEQPISEDALVDILESLLAANGVVMVRGSSGIYRLGSPERLRKELPIRTDLPNMASKGYTTRIIPLENISVLEAMKVLKPLGVESNIVHVDAVRNLLMASAPAPVMENIIRTLQIFDVDVLSGMSFGIYEVFNIDATTVVERFKELLGNEQLSPLSGMVKLVAMEEINSVMVITPRAHYLDKARDWVERLDTPLGVDENRAPVQLYVYNVENGDAKKLADLLSELFGKGSALLNEPKNSGAVAPGKAKQKVGSKAGGTANKAIAKTRTQSETTENVLQIVANESNNSLLVLAEPRIWRTIRSALSKIDVEPAQVLVEVSIWEVTLDNSLRYGVEWFFNNRFNSGDLGVATLDVGSAGIGATIPGFSYLVSDLAGGWEGVINTLDSESRVEVLSSPSVLVLDNETAEITVGNQQPVRVGSSVTDGGTVTDNIQFKDTGVSLKVTPRVNAGGLVVMEIFQDVTDIGNIDEATGQRAFLQRSINSTVAIQSGDTIVLGGLIQQNASKGSSGLPFLSRIPVFGALFGSQSDSTIRTELLVTISPRAVNQYKDMERIGRAFRERMSQLTEAFEIGLP